MNKLEKAIEVKNMSKDFKLFYDKANSFKEKLLFWKKGESKDRVLHILQNINIDIFKGETVALVGTNGSGKSTLLKMMTKIIYPTSGSITVNGRISSLIELGAGFHPDFTGRENIYFNSAIYGMSKETVDARLDEIIAFSELEDFIDNPVRTYSSGMYTRLAFSIAISVDADILLVDEILSVGDQHFQDKCYSKMKELQKNGVTIVLVTHSMGVVEDFCQRAIWIYNGKVRLDGDSKEVIQAYLKECA